MSDLREAFMRPSKLLYRMSSYRNRGKWTFTVNERIWVTCCIMIENLWPVSGHRGFTGKNLVSPCALYQAHLRFLTFLSLSSGGVTLLSSYALSYIASCVCSLWTLVFYASSSCVCVWEGLPDIEKCAPVEGGGAWSRYFVDEVYVRDFSWLWCDKKGQF